MKKLLLLSLITLSSAVNACIPGLNFVSNLSSHLYTQGIATLLAEGGQAGTYVGSTIGSYIGSAIQIPLGGEIGGEVGRLIVEGAGKQVQHLPQDQRLCVAGGLIAAGYVVARYGTRIVIGLPV